MNSSELRISNHVNIDGKPFELNRKRFEWAVCKQVCDEITPIEITEKGLLDLGFEKIGDMLILKDKHNTHFRFHVLDEDGKMICRYIDIVKVKNNGKMSSIEIPLYRLKYLHQVENFVHTFFWEAPKYL